MIDLNRLAKEHGYDSPTKQTVRIANLEAIKRLPILWDRDHITRDAVTLCGFQDKEAQLWLNQPICPLVPGKGRLIGCNGPDPGAETGKRTGLTKQDIIDRSKAIIEHNKQFFADATQQGLLHWHYGLLEPALKQDLFPNAAIFLVDSHYSIGRHHIGELLRPYIYALARAAARHGHAFLFFNFKKSGLPAYSRVPAMPTNENVENLLVALAGLLNRYSTRYYTPENIQHGSYRSEGHRWTMMYVRVTLDRAELRGRLSKRLAQEYWGDFNPYGHLP